MAGSVNKAMILGHLGKDPETRRTQDGKPICNLSVATSESWVDKRSGERVQRTEWHRVVIFNENLAKIADQYLRKGSKVFIEGSLQTRKWQDQQGNDRYSTEIVLAAYNGSLTLLDRREDGDGGGDSSAGRDYQAPASSSSSKPSGNYDKTIDYDDQIPF